MESQPTIPGSILSVLGSPQLLAIRLFDARCELFAFVYSPITSHNSPITNAKQCVSGKNSFYNRVYVTQFFPIFLFAFIAFVGVLREFASVCRGERAGHSQWQRIFNQHVYAALVLSYVVLPTVAALQFKALRCETLDHDGSSFLKEDSAVSCLSASYAYFRAIVILGIVVYLSIPLAWFVLLWRVRRDVNPPDETLESALELRKTRDHLKCLEFLFSDYLPSMWGYEIYETVKRLFFVAALPFFGEPVFRAFIGILASACAVHWARESWPFIESTNSQLAFTANLQIQGVYFASLLLLTDSMNGFGLSDNAVGCLLLLLNLVCFALVAYWCVKIEIRELRLARWKSERLSKIEWACDFSATKFLTTFEKVMETAIPASHMLVFHYASIGAVKKMLRSGLSVQNSGDGVEVGK